MLTQPHPQILSPSSSAGFFPSEDKTLILQQYARARVYSEEDYLARDIRKLRKAEDEMESVVRAQPQLTPEDIFEMTCERAGLSVADGLRAKEYQRKWPMAEKSLA